MSKKIAGEEGFDELSAATHETGDALEDLGNRARGLGKAIADHATGEVGAFGTVVSSLTTPPRIPCQACGSDALPFDHPQGFYACGRCGTLQQAHTTLRADYEAKVAALASGEVLTIGGPFRGQRSLSTLRERVIDGTYLLEQAGAVLLMLSLGMALQETNDNRTLTFIKG